MYIAIALHRTKANEAKAMRTSQCCGIAEEEVSAASAPCLSSFTSMRTQFCPSIVCLYRSSSVSTSNIYYNKVFRGVRWEFLHSFYVVLCRNCRMHEPESKYSTESAVDAVFMLYSVHNVDEIKRRKKKMGKKKEVKLCWMVWRVLLCALHECHTPSSAFHLIIPFVV